MVESIRISGLEEYPLTFVLGQNLFLMIYFSLGAMGMWSIKVMHFPIFSLSYLLFIFVMLAFILRKHLCTHCYYYGKWCSTGWGKLAALLFEKESGNYLLGIKLAKITWGGATIFPIFVMLFLLFFRFDFVVLLIFLSFVLLTLLNFVIHKHSCSHCKMRRICPASMVKYK